MAAKKTAQDYRQLAKDLGLTWCGPDLPKGYRGKTNWRCDLGHPEFQACYADLYTIRKYHKSSGCIYCSGKKADVTTSLATLRPDIAALWHPSKNKPTTPDAVTPGSNRKFHWICPENPDHEIYRAPYEHIRLKGFCRQCNSLSAKYPELAAQWHPDRNGALTPFDISYGYDKEVWWICQYGHAWLARPNNRTANGSGCPLCSRQTSKLEIAISTELGAVFPDAKRKVRIEGNECDVFIPSLRIAIEIDGAYWHADHADRDIEKTKALNGAGVGVIRLRQIPLEKLGPFDIVHAKNASHHSLAKKTLDAIVKARPQLSANEEVRRYLKSESLQAVRLYRKVMAQLPAPDSADSLAARLPAIAAHWNYELNSPVTPFMVTPGSAEVYVWNCPVGHSPYRYSVKERVRRAGSPGRGGSGCPVCSGLEVTFETSIASKLDVADAMWHPTRNLPVEPEQVRYKEAHIKYWWKCQDCGSDFKAIPYNVLVLNTGHKSCRTSKSRMSANVRRIGSLAAKVPEVLVLWDARRNTAFNPDDVTPGSHKRVYTRCNNCGKEWPNPRAVRDLQNLLRTHKCR